MTHISINRKPDAGEITAVFLKIGILLTGIGWLVAGSINGDCGQALTGCVVMYTSTKL